MNGENDVALNIFGQRNPLALKVQKRKLTSPTGGRN